MNKFRPTVVWDDVWDISDYVKKRSLFHDLNHRSRSLDFGRLERANVGYDFCHRVGDNCKPHLNISDDLWRVPRSGRPC
jgi:hypothetical protein